MDRLEKKPKEILADDATEGIGLLLRLRFPWLLLGLVGGALASFLVSRFESILSQNIALAFFVPMIVYMSDAVGTQTETIYVRNLAKKQIRLLSYLTKELAIGFLLGIVFGLLIGIFAYLWLNSVETAFTVALAMAVNVTIAPAVALLTASFLHKEHSDPALGAGPFSTVLQDIISLLIYFLIASLILFNN